MVKEIEEQKRMRVFENKMEEIAIKEKELKSREEDVLA